MRRARTVVAAISATLLLGCGIENLFMGELTRGSQREVPGAGVRTITGRAPGLQGAAVAFFGGTGELLADVAASVARNAAGQDVFSAAFSAADDHVNLVLVVARGGAFAWGLVPKLERKTSVLQADDEVPMEALQENMGDLGTDTTFAVLLVLAKARSLGMTLNAVSPGAAGGAVREVLALKAARDGRVAPLAEMVTTMTARPGSHPALRPFPDAAGSYFDPTGLASDVVIAAADFETALQNALAAFEFNLCYVPDRITVVLMADIGPGGLDRNCKPIDRFRWTKDLPGKQMFVTGSIHETTTRCGADPPPCLEQDVIDRASQDLLGDWSPNVREMYDDGTHGDAVAGDGVWTLAIELPYFEPGPDGRSVRIGYKYTWGYPAQGWTDSEEWPGNKRILELVDQNGDRIITRRDLFGDETTNKDKANQLLPTKGGCGKVVFLSDGPQPACTNDVLEARIDTDGDCELDTWPAPGKAFPLTVDCPGAP